MRILPHKSPAFTASGTYTEAWSGISNGNTWTEIQTGADVDWDSRNSTAFTTSGTTNANAPNGVSVVLACSSGTGRFGTVLGTELAAGTGDKTVYGIIDAFASDSGQAAIIGYRSATPTVTGFKIRGNADTTFDVTASLDEIVDAGTGTEIKTSIAQGRWEFSIEVSGTSVDFYWWAQGAGKPGSPDATLSTGGGDVVFDNLIFMMGHTSTSIDLETYEVVIS